MADLAKEAMDHWDALEKDSGTSLRWMSGLLNFGDKDYGGDTPEVGCKCGFVLDIDLPLLGTLTGPIPNLKRLDMTYKECMALLH